MTEKRVNKPTARMHEKTASILKKVIKSPELTPGERAMASIYAQLVDRRLPRRR